ncbi:MAG: universal stress protein [Micropepsaceae bacterium]
MTERDRRMFKSILVPVDVAHESSWIHALPQAIKMAKADKAHLTLMTVVRQTSNMFEGVYLSFQLEKIMAEAKERLASIAFAYRDAGVEIAQDVRMGSIGGEVLAAVRELDIDLVVMASHRPEMIDYLIGPNAAHVALNARCSVLVLRPEAGA